MDRSQRATVEIYRNYKWASAGVFVRGRIVERTPTLLGDDEFETQDIYCAIEEEACSGGDVLIWGEAKVVYTWHLCFATRQS